MKTMKALCCCSLLLVSGILAASCTRNQSTGEQQKAESEMVMDWLAGNGNWINSEHVPAIITSDQAYEAISGKTLFIDLRDPSQYAAGHIPKSINIQPDELLETLDNRLDINAFDKVVFVCSRGQLSAWVNAIVRLLGYNNTYSIRYGMNAWDTSFAAKGWDKVVSDRWADRQLNEQAQKPSTIHKLPEIHSNLSTGYEIVHRRAAELLAETSDKHFIEFDTLAANPEDYFIINYWSPKDYEEAGHLPGAWQFSPRKSLSKDELLLAIPTTKKVVVYCFTGHHSAHAVAYLRMLGYDAYSLLYGANAFMHSLMHREGWPPSHQWSEQQKRSYPMSNSAILPTVNSNQIKAAAKGGC